MTQTQIPDKMTAVLLDSYTGADALRVEEQPVPKPGPNQVLVKVAASPINPSDLAFLEGDYGFRKQTPVVPGFEGSGTVVAVGSGVMGKYLNGKRVACISQGKGDGEALRINRPDEDSNLVSLIYGDTRRSRIDRLYRNNRINWVNAHIIIGTTG